MKQKVTKKEIQEILLHYAERYNQLSFIEQDPISIPHQFHRKQLQAQRCGHQPRCLHPHQPDRGRGAAELLGGEQLPSKKRRRGFEPIRR